MARFSPPADADAHERGAGVVHDGAHVGEVQVDEPGHGDEVGDALHALAQDVVGVLERLDDAGVALDDLEQPVVGDHDDGVGHLPAARRCRRSAWRWRRLPSNANGRVTMAMVTAPSSRAICGHHGRAAGAGAAALAGGDEHQVGAAQGAALIWSRLTSIGLTADLGVGAAAETVRDLLADVDLDVGVAHLAAAARRC